MRSNFSTDIKPSILSIVGPAFVLVSILLLVIKESPFYIDLSAVAMAGLLISWRWKVRGALIASFVLAAVLTYDFFVEGDAIGLWEAGLSFSIAIAFGVTALASAETLETIRRASEQALLEMEEWEKKLTETLGFKERLEAEAVVKADHVEELKKQLKSAHAEAEQQKRLFSMSRDEIAHLLSQREKAELQAIDLRRQLNLEKEKKDELAQHFKALQIGSEKTLEQYAKKIEEAEGTIQDLAGQLHSLADKLKALQGEKEQLEKELDAALKPSEELLDHAQGGRYVGLYKQLQEQFSEKKAQLALARSALFMREEELLLLKQQWIEEEEFDSSGEMAQLFEAQSVLLKRVLAQEEEIVALEEILSVYLPLISRL